MAELSVYDVLETFLYAPTVQRGDEPPYRLWPTEDVLQRGIELLEAHRGASVPT